MEGVYLEIDDALLTPFPSERLCAYPVSTRVNSPKNYMPELIEAAP